LFDVIKVVAIVWTKTDRRSDRTAVGTEIVADEITVSLSVALESERGGRSGLPGAWLKEGDSARDKVSEDACVHRGSTRTALDKTKGHAESRVTKSEIKGDSRTC